eukprot:TRINITY_DN107078_c0_g1_i1.p1 TRINITY_DN107078_c0_g1~~TRINITY_DN107078_c0_g1_i1.p1  ORF type:complete len:564 (-),score=93.75 TRINITY_DN107078_c0_g1_i1:146-1837(-)
MMEVTIQLRKDGNLGAHSQDEILRCVQDEYVNRYLAQLGIAATPANKSQVMRYRPLDDMEVHGIWPEDSTAAIADAVKIAPPLRHRMYDDADGKPIDKSIYSYLYGDADDIAVEPPEVPGRTIFPIDLSEPVETPAARGPAGKVAREIMDELEREKQAALARAKQRANPGSTGAGAHATVGGGKVDSDLRQRYKQELDLLKSKFIFPFACERPVKEGSKITELQPWSPEGPLDMELQGDRSGEVCHPVAVELEQIQKILKSWVQNQLPLELLSSRGREDPKFLNELRDRLWASDICQLTGLLAHLLYWNVFGHCRRPDQVRLGHKALQGIVAKAHERWVELERKHKVNSLGINLGMPCVLLVLKYGVERCFESQYPNIFSETGGDFFLRQGLVYRINTLVMRLFDPDNTYARFARLDGTNAGMAICRKLDLLASAESQNRTKSKRLQGRVNRATPLCRAALQAGQEKGGGIGTDGPETRRLLHRSELGGCAPLANVVVPPEEPRWRTALLTAAMHRVGMKAEPKVPVSVGSSARMSSTLGPMSARSRATAKSQTGMSGAMSAR